MLTIHSGAQHDTYLSGGKLKLTYASKHMSLCKYLTVASWAIVALQF